MMKAACPRAFEVEAMRDGRLTGADVVRFQAHLSVCAHCARELRALESLATALRRSEGAHVTDTDELAVRRRRVRLLSAFNATLVPGSPRASHAWIRRVPLLAGVGALGVLALVFGLRAERSPLSVPPGPSSGVFEPVTVQPDDSARWSRQIAGPLEKIRIEAGTLAIRVDHTRSTRRLLVLLPDGEVEDVGTSFTVTVQNGRTTRVSVRDGKVILRLGGQSALGLGAGDAWTPESSARAATPATSGAAAEPLLAPVAQRDDAASSAARKASPTPHRPAASSPTASSQPIAARDPGLDFRAALAAMRAGDQSSAAARFSAFLVHHPRDPRAEDAAYLRVISLQRAGDSHAMQAAARDYVRRYPRGFRIAEVAPLAE